MFIFQPARYLLAKIIKNNAHYLGGVILDAGAGAFSRYKKYFSFEKYLTLDIDSQSKADFISSMDNMPLANESVDGILSTQALGDMRDLRKTASEFKRVLKKGGNLLLTDDFMSFLHDEPHDYWRFTNFGLREILETAGFEVIKEEKIGGFWTVIAQFKIRYLIEKLRLNRESSGLKRMMDKFLAVMIKIYGKLMCFFDNIDRSEINKKYAIGFLMVARKK